MTMLGMMILWEGTSRMLWRRQPALRPQAAPRRHVRAGGSSTRTPTLKVTRPQVRKRSVTVGIKRGEVAMTHHETIAFDLRMLIMTVIRTQVSLTIVTTRNRILCNILWFWNSKYLRTHL